MPHVALLLRSVQMHSFAATGSISFPADFVECCYVQVEQKQLPRDCKNQQAFDTYLRCV